jgi:Ca2+-binding RTX toxin-like protein
MSTIIGTNGNDSLYGTSGDDTILGGAGNDTLDGGVGNASLDGGAGDDSLTGSLDRGNQTLLGGDGNDVLTLFGTSYYDDKRTLLAEGGAGDDVFNTYFYNPSNKITLSGGTGSDTYKFAAMAATSYVISDFAVGAGGDRLDLTALLAQDISQDGAGGNPLGTVVRLVQQGSDTLLQAHFTVSSLSSGSSDPYHTIVVLKGVTASTLTAANFVDGLPPNGAAVPGLNWQGSDTGSSKGGTYYDDTLTGGAGKDTLYGNGGNDQLSGGGGNDDLDGGTGNDTLIGGAGDDTLRAYAGSDSIRGGDGNDVLSIMLAGGASTIYGDAGDDTFDVRYSYGRGSVVLDGGSGNDTIYASTGDTTSTVATGGSGSDTYALNPYGGLTVTDFTAGAGGDIIDVFAFVDDVLNRAIGLPGGNPFSQANGVLRLQQSGADTLLMFDEDGAGNYYAAKTLLVLKNVRASTLTSDNFVGGYKLDGSYMPGQLIQPQGDGSWKNGTSFDDTMIGTAGNDSFDGKRGNDLLDGGAGNDVLDGGSGQDTLFGGAGNDRLTLDSGGGLLDGGAGNDTLTISDSRDDVDVVADGGDGDDALSLFGNGPAHGTANISGGNGNDTITFGNSYDKPVNWIVNGGAGVDTFVLHWNNYIGPSYKYQDSPTISDFQTGAGGDRLDLYYIVGSSDLYREVGGNPFAAGSVLRVVQSGADTLLQVDLDGAAESDGYHTFVTLKNVQATDLTADNFVNGYQPDGRVMPGLNMTASAGEPNLNGAAFNDTLIGSANTSWLSGMGGDDLLRANNLPGRGSSLSGGGGADTLIGSLSNDTLDGGKGNDSMDGGDGDDSLVSDAGADTLLGGAGNDTLQFYYDYRQGPLVADGGAGDDLFQLPTSDQRLRTLTGGEGVDRYVFWGSTYNFDSPLHITDFLAGSGGDVLDFSHLTSYGHETADPFDPAIHVLRWTQLGADAVLQYDIQWTNEYKTILTLENVRVEDISAANFAAVNVKASGYDKLYGGLGADTLTGSSRNELLDGGAGNDSMTGGLGNDDYIVNDARDIVVEAAGGGTDSVRASVNYILPDNVESLTLTGSATQASSNAAGGTLYANASMDSTLLGATGNDFLYGLGGNDVLKAGGGNDTVDGGGGTDVLQLMGAMADYVISKVSASDTRFSNAATGENVLVRAVESIQFTDGVRSLAQLLSAQATEGNDVLTGSSGNDLLSGRGGNDTLNGLDGNDTLDGGLGNDSMNGGAGDDVYLVDAADDQVTEAANGGIDTVRTTLSTYTLGANLENLSYTGTGAFTGSGNVLNNAITGGDKGNKIDGGAGNDSLSGGLGADSLLGDTGNDTLVASAGKDVLDGGDGDDVLAGLGKFADYTIARPSATETTLTDKSGNVILVRGVERFVFADGERALDVVQDNIASSGNDRLHGEDGNDTINGLAGADTMTGKDGDDTYVIDNLGDTIVEQAGEGTDLVQVALTVAGTYVLAANLENATVTAAASIAVNLTGNALDNELRGNAAANTLTGGAGNDTLDGGAGNDKLLGGLGDDVYVISETGDSITEAVGEGIDTVRTALATYTLGLNAENLVYTGKSAFSGVGNALDNAFIVGSSTSSKIDGGAGNDVLRGLGDLASYTITRPTATDTVLTDKAGNVISVRNVESFEFDGVLKTLAEVQYNIASVGNDKLFGGDGIDTLNGGLGADTLSGGKGNDAYVIDNVGDTIIENSGEGTDLAQVALTAAGTYKLGDNVENATVTAAANIAVSLTGNDLDNALTGNAAANTLTGGAGNDTLDGATGADKLIGGTGNDTYVVDNTGDSVAEAVGEGTDSVRTSFANYTLTVNVENLSYTGTAAFTGTGNALDNIIIGSAKGGKLDGGAGNDSLVGGAGADSLLGGVGNDTLTAGSGKDTIDGGTGDDVLRALAGWSNYTVTRPNASDTVLTDKSGNLITVRGVESFVFDGVTKTLLEVQDNIASIGNDKLSGGDGVDTLNGGTGADTLSGGLGNDVYVIDNLGDVIIETTDEGVDLAQVALTTAGTYKLGDNVENAIVTAAANIAASITGNALDNVLTGNAAANTLTGGAGNDTLDGAAGADKLIGGIGNDIYVVDNAGDVVTEALGEGTDTVRTSLASITLAANVENLIYTGAAAFTGTGNALDNTITGGDKGNKLDGGAGNDTLTGGLGNDSLVGGAGDDVLHASLGNDTIDGGLGNDVLQGLGARSDYAVAHTNATDWVLVDRNGVTLTARNVETLAFSDGALKPTELGTVATTGNDALLGTDHNDVLNGFAGADTMNGGLGDDSYTVDALSDVVIEAADGGSDTVNVALAAGTYVVAANVEVAKITSAAAINLTGNALDNLLTGNATANTLLGGDGSDTLIGGAGNDTLTGGTGADSFVLNSLVGSDTITDFASGTDVLQLDLLALGIGNRDAVLNGALTRSAPGGFDADAELVLFTQKMTSATTAKAAAIIGSASNAYAIGDTALFAVATSSATVLYRFQSAGNDALVSANELTVVATLTGTQTVALADFAINL